MVVFSIIILAAAEPGEALAEPAAPIAEAATEASSDPVASPVEAPADPAASPATKASVRSGGDAEEDLAERVRRSRRRRADVLVGGSGSDALYGDPGVAKGESTFLGERRPAFLRPRWPGGALALGALVGFGAGYYYAGSPRWGFIFTLADALLVGGFVVSTVELNNLVVQHDFNTGMSLARNERDMTKLEQRWYTASVLFALLEVGSRAFQAFGGLRTARRTNDGLASFSFVPLGDSGGGMQLRLEW